jgi:hypothetical protein
MVGSSLAQLNPVEHGVSPRPETESGEKRRRGRDLVTGLATSKDGVDLERGQADPRCFGTGGFVVLEIEMLRPLRKIGELVFRFLDYRKAQHEARA